MGLSNNNVKRIKKIICIIDILLFMFLMTSCSKKQVYDIEPLMGLSWFSDKNQVMENVSSLKFVSEREENGMTLLDYDGAVLYNMEMGVTFCFTERGLVGLDYHDTKHNMSYIKWLEQIEDKYGIPNENAVDSASWFENPVGENTAVYLFDLVEGVQISYYGTTDTPDKTYMKRIDN